MLVVHSEADGAGRVVVHVRGYVDLETEAQFGQALRAALADEGVRELVVDLAQVPFLDSSGVRVLLEARLTATSRDALLVVRNPQAVVDQVLQITGVAELLGLPAAPDRYGRRQRG